MALSSALGGVFFLPHILVLLIKKEKNLLADYLVALSDWGGKFMILPGLQFSGGIDLDIVLIIM